VDINAKRKFVMLKIRSILAGDHRFLNWGLVFLSLFLIGISVYLKKWLFLKGGLFLLGFSSGLISIPSSILLAILLLPALEIPTLLLGIPNQFLIDWVMIGTGLHLFRGFSTLKIHILIPSLLLLGLGMAILFLPEFYSIAQLAGDDLSLLALLKTFKSSFYLWDIQNNPFHSISVAFGLFSTSFFIIGVGRWVTKALKINRQKLITCISLSSLLPCIWGILQMPKIGLLPIINTVDIGGTFQNGNHLSYFAGLIILVQLIALSLQPSGMRRVMHGLVLSLGIFCLFLGQGRTAILALGISLVCLIPLAVDLPKRALWSRQAFLFALFVSAVAVGTFYFLDFKNFSGLLELEKIIQSGHYTDLLYAGGRTGIYKASYDFIANHWLFGMGQGYFFNKAGLDLELHSILPDWTLGVGLPILFLSLVPFFYRIPSVCRAAYRSADMSKKLALVALIYICLSTFPDVYFSFRSLLAMSLAVLLLIDPKDLKPIGNRTYGFLSLVILVIGGASIVSPHFRPFVFKIYPEEVQPVSSSTPVIIGSKVEYPLSPVATFNWTSVGARIELTHECKGLLIHSPFKQSGHTISYRSAGLHDIYPDMNFAKAKTLFEGAPNFELSVGETMWRSVCFCSSSEQTKYIDLLSSRANYINFSKSLNTPPDRRYVGFKISAFKPNLDPNSKENGEKLLPISCERINI
jgi:hypothetical protein